MTMVINDQINAVATILLLNNNTMKRLLSVLLLLLSVVTANSQELQCSLSEEDVVRRDPNLREMTYDVGDGPQTTWVYVEPPVETFYPPGQAPASTKVVPKFNGFAGKFINMSNQKVTLYWEKHAGGPKVAMRNHNPWTASGTATFPTHRFVFTPVNDPDTILARFIVGEYPENIYVYNPYLVEGDPEATEKNLKEHLKKKEDREKYESWRKTLSFNEQYLNFTGRSYLAHYLRDPPMHYMWPADYIGQTHWVESRETQFTSFPPKDKLQPITVLGKKRRLKDSDPRILQEYRDSGTMNMTLRVISVAPRVLQIDNFLSSTEVDHITELASGIKLSASSTGDISAGEKRVKPEEETKTRTSYNSWVSRDRSPILDAIYRRAADLMRIDEAMFRRRDKGEIPGYENLKTLSEDLQLVNYKETQEYTSHHDFGYARIDEKMQGARFATLLLYLNEGMKGGETSFPRWVNAETFRELKAVPEIGKAVLFYSQLPDGNLDDFSQHAALPVTEGEKWLINLWVWADEYR